MTVLPIHVEQDRRLVGGGCFQEKMINGCGPYLYHVTKHHGRQTWRYCGKVGSARAQAARAAIYQPDYEEDEPLNRVGKTQVSDGNSRPIVKRRG